MTGTGIWARRASAAMLRGAGGTSVSLRLAAPAGATVADELGLSVGEVREVLLSPVLLRANAGGAVLLVSADVLEGVLALHDAKAVRDALGDATGVMAFGEWMLIDAIEAREVAGSAYLYRIVLRATAGSA